MRRPTPGPWEACPSCAGKVNGWYIDGVPIGNYRDAQFANEADAVLMAASKELLAMCKELLDGPNLSDATYMRWKDIRNRACELIAKAEGVAPT